ncbi:MAG: AAA family ATPase, partial [Methanomassiliicoccaceae archaeon]|nr:AAA family ATPase [Methanomassiliicoccaceae archaeon]
MAEKYIKRIIDKELQKHLELMGAILVEGPKWCGKTRTSKEFAKSVLSITNKNQINYLNLLLENGSFGFLDEEPPMLIDEWQLAPGIWDAVRTVVDNRGKRGQFILAGSSVPPKDSEPLHSGAGRIGRLTMRTMSLFESGESNGKVSLKGLFNPGYKVEGHSDLSVEGLAAAVARGGWPEGLNCKEEDATRTVDQYLKAIVNSDISRANDSNMDPMTVKRIIESIARNISTYAPLETIRKDAAGESGTLSANTLKKYLDAMQSIFLIENLPAWNPHMRSKTKLITS